MLQTHQSEAQPKAPKRQLLHSASKGAPGPDAVNAYINGVHLKESESFRFSSYWDSLLVLPCRTDSL